VEAGPQVSGSQQNTGFKGSAARFLYSILKREKYAKQTQNIPNDHKIYQMTIKYTK
jgi:hypothetical protein